MAERNNRETYREVLRLSRTRNTRDSKTETNQLSPNKAVKGKFVTLFLDGALFQKRTPSRGKQRGSEWQTPYLGRKSEREIVEEGGKK